MVMFHTKVLKKPIHFLKKIFFSQFEFISLKKSQILCKSTLFPQDYAEKCQELLDPLALILNFDEMFTKLIMGYSFFQRKGSFMFELFEHKII